MMTTLFSVGLLALATGLALFVPLWVKVQREKDAQVAAVLIRSRRSDR